MKEIRQESASIVYSDMTGSLRFRIRWNGFPVTELGAYIFSDHIEVSELNKKKETGTYCTENGTEETPADDMPQAAGNQVEEICLPRFLRKIGRYAFYNCFKLQTSEILRRNERSRCRCADRMPQDGTDYSGNR